MDQYQYDGWLVVELAYDDRVKLTRSFEENILRSVWYLKGMHARSSKGV